MTTTSAYPKDRLNREHVGQLDRLIFSNPDGPFAILKLTDGSSVKGPFDADRFARGTIYRFHGRWGDGRYGPEFTADTFVTEAPHSKLAVVRYLSETCRGIGVRTAEELFARFGGDVVRLLREEPGAIVAAGLMTDALADQAAEDLRTFAHVEKTKVDLFGLFAGRGFTGKLIDRCISRWGVEAPRIIARDPFTLLVNKLPSCGFKRCDKFYLDQGRPPLALKRQALAGWNCLRQDRTGSTWIDARDAVSAIREAVPRSEPIDALRLLIRAGWVRVRRDGGSRYVALRDRADAEQRIADGVRRLLRGRLAWPTDILTSQVEGDGLPSAHQGEQLRLATAGSVGCFVGGPGTGKTHTLSFLLKQLIADCGLSSIAVCAPTGKAAVRAGEALRARGLAIRASTIHQLLEIGRNGHDGDGWGFQRNRTNPLGERFVVVDESSMIDASLMADLFDALADGTQVLFVGDPYQLPPVGHGAPLRDLIDSGVVPTGELTEVRRNAGAIVRACVAIKAGLPVEFSGRIDPDAADPLNFKSVECDQAEVPELVEKILESLTRFDRAWETQVIVPLNEKSEASRVKLNERLGKLLNPDGRSARGNPFRVNDKVICLRNTRLKPVMPLARFGRPEMAADAGNYQPTQAPDGSAEWYVANGEIGRVVAVNEKVSVVRFGGSDSTDIPLVNVPVGKKRQEGDDDGPEGSASDFDLAWAITVHKSQGSEWPCVVCVVDDAGQAIADRNYWYTAVSRARRLGIVVGPRGVFDRQAKRVSMVKRRTFLSEMVKVKGEPEGGQ